ncbi:hypothetical protein [Marinilabilia salmonicolor]|uniref:hypothetical protein n=1 Tax=Marinilabilia salmonicolor TaxID=989 RepID=UPI0002E8863D|nr:hypothetical protein [Marinilabilia salmonicolor]
MRRITAFLLSIAGTTVSAVARMLSDSEKKESTSQPGSDHSPKTSTTPEATGKELYKTTGIKKAEVKQLTKNAPFIIPGIITGTACVRPDEHDKYNVDILDPNGNNIGHIEKNRRLCNSLEAWHQGSVFTFVKVTESGEIETSSGTAFIPAGLPREETKKLKEVFDKLAKRNKILSEENISSKDYLEILKDHKQISKTLVALNIDDLINIALSKRLIPALSRQMEDQQDWQGLLKLEKHSDLIDELSERFAGTTYRRISKAKKNTGQKI